MHIYLQANVKYQLPKAAFVLTSNIGGPFLLVWWCLLVESLYCVNHSTAANDVKERAVSMPGFVCDIAQTEWRAAVFTEELVR